MKIFSRLIPVLLLLMVPPLARAATITGLNFIQQSGIAIRQTNNPTGGTVDVALSNTVAAATGSFPGLTNSAATATTVAQYDANKGFISIAAGAIGEYLAQTASGFGWSNVTASGSSGPTTNAPPYTIAINGGPGSTNIVIDMLALGATNAVRATLTGNTGIMFTNVVDGMYVTVIPKQGAAGFMNLTTNGTWGFNVRFGDDFTSITLNTNGGRKDYLRFFGDGTNAIFLGSARNYAP